MGGAMMVRHPVLVKPSIQPLCSQTTRCKELETLTASLQEKLQIAEETVAVISKTSEVSTMMATVAMC